MQGVFKLMQGEAHIGDFVIDSDKNIWTYAAAAETAPEAQPLVFRLLMRDQGGDTLSGDAVRDWIMERAPEPTYEFIDALMYRIGIAEYDPLAFVAYNGGRFNKDDYYLTGA